MIGRDHKWLERHTQIFNTHAAHLSIAECGAAFSLALYYGEHGRLPKSDQDLAQIVGISTKEFIDLAGDHASEWGLMRTLRETIIAVMYGEHAR
jgi:uncharacterized protein YdaU (DUF1376 family)